MFPKELLGLIPKRELEFNTELAQKTVLISKALYRMDPTEI